MTSNTHQLSNGSRQLSIKMLSLTMQQANTVVLNYTELYKFVIITPLVFLGCK
jgi:hypothetical protein